VGVLEAIDPDVITRNGELCLMYFSTGLN
jgi:hypothetical protein